MYALIALYIDVYREIWHRHLPNDQSPDYHTSILTIDKAEPLDEGLYTCRAIESTIEQCTSVYVNIKNDPIVKIIPMSITVQKVIFLFFHDSEGTLDIFAPIFFFFFFLLSTLI